MNNDQKRSALALLKGPGIRFGVVGACLTGLDLILFQVLANMLHVSVFGIDPGVCAVWIGAPIVIVLNFFISHKFVWRSNTSKRATILPFFGLNLFSGVIVQSLVVALVVWLISMLDWIMLDTAITNLFAKCIAVGVGMIINFFGAKYVFKG